MFTDKTGFTLCGRCYQLHENGEALDVMSRISEDDRDMLVLAESGVHRQSKLGRNFPIEDWNDLKARRLIRQNPSGYCYTTFLGKESLDQDIPATVASP